MNVHLGGSHHLSNWRRSNDRALRCFDRFGCRRQIGLDPLNFGGGNIYVAALVRGAWVEASVRPNQDAPFVADREPIAKHRYLRSGGCSRKTTQHQKEAE